MISFDYLDGIENEAMNSVVELLKEVIDEGLVFCTCPTCMLDITTMTLNKIKPRYYNSLLGPYNNLDDKKEYRSEVKKELLNSISKVMSCPNH